jgi:hypothetical protein
VPRRRGEDVREALWLVDHHVVCAADVLHVPTILPGRFAARIEALARVSDGAEVDLVLDALAGSSEVNRLQVHTEIGCGVSIDCTQALFFSSECPVRRVPTYTSSRSFRSRIRRRMVFVLTPTILAALSIDTCVGSTCATRRIGRSSRHCSILAVRWFSDASCQKTSSGLMVRCSIAIAFRASAWRLPRPFIDEYDPSRFDAVQIAQECSDIRTQLRSKIEMRLPRNAHGSDHS